MRLAIDLETRRFLSADLRPITSIQVKRRDLVPFELQFANGNEVVELPSSANIVLGIKQEGDFAGEFLSFGTFSKSGTGTNTKYLLDLSFNTVALNQAFPAAEPASLSAMLEVEWSTGSNIFSSITLPVTISNDVIRGDEGTPTAAPLFYTSSTQDFRATQAEAEAATNNDKWMSPLRVAQTLAAKISAFLTWANITGKPATFPPEAHTHAISQVTNLQASLDAKIANTNPTINGELTVDSGDQVKIAGNRIWSGFGPTILEFEEARLNFSGNDVLNWGTSGQLRIGTRTLKDLGAPVDANDAVRKTELDFKVTNAGGIARIERVTSMPASPNATTLYIVIP
jgi:hypothetical protein